MKQCKMLFVAIGCIALLCAGASNVSAQALDNTWYQVDISVKAETVNIDDGSVNSKVRLARTGYLYIYDQCGDYSIVLFSETAVDVWIGIGGVGIGGVGIPAEVINDDITYMPSMAWEFHTPDPTILSVYLSGKFTIKLNKDDTLKKVTFSTPGAILMTRQMNVDNDVPWGKVKVKVKMIDENDLPAGVPLP